MSSRNLKNLVYLSVLVINQSFAQDKLDIKFGKINSNVFGPSAVKFDSGANALVIADIGSTYFEGNDQGYFTIVFTRFLRVKILNKNGFGIGDQQISLYHNSDGDFEKLTAFKASTFNFDNGAISETKLDDKSIYDDKDHKDYIKKKFTMPALKVGSIFDIQYSIKSPFYQQLMPWIFQGNYPCLWSEYEVTIAPPFHYAMKLQGDQHFDIDISKEIDKTYSIRELNGIAQTNMYSYTGAAVYRRWVKRNIPALHEEPFITTLGNYNTRVSFQLNFIQMSNQDEKHEYLSSWNKASKDLLEYELFGLALNHENMWMADEFKNLIDEGNLKEEKTYKIFNYVRDNFRAVSDKGMYVSSSLKNVFKTRQGNVADINLLLTAMLRKAGIRADPLILSTRDNGVANPGYPLINEYNYVICVAYPEDKMVTLDASLPYIGYGDLPSRCYNGWGHIINEEHSLPVNFSTDSLHETAITSVIMINDEKGFPSGAYRSTFGKNDSYLAREEILGNGEESYKKKIRDSYGTNFTMENFGVDSLKKYVFPLTVHFDFDLKEMTSGDIIYFDPVLDLTYKSNPFISMDRHYPVEMPYRIDKTYLLNMDIPSGYQVEELPKSVRVNYNGNEGRFEYLIQKGETSLQLRVQIKLNKSFFTTDEYATLREFFASVVKKESEQIVFKKIK